MCSLISCTSRRVRESCVDERLAVDLHTFDQLCDAYCITYSCSYIAILYSVGQGRDDVGGKSGGGSRRVLSSSPDPGACTCTM